MQPAASIASFAPWVARVRRLLGRPAAPSPVARPVASELPPPEPPASEQFVSGFAPSLMPVADAAPPSGEERTRYLAWLLAAPARPCDPDHETASRVLDALDRELDSPKGCARLLRRAPNVVPRLMEALRCESYSSFVIASHIQKDVVLTAEVMRLARSCLYARGHQRSCTVAQAVDLLGSAGLNEVIARVLFRPMFNAPAGSRASTAGSRVLEDAYRSAMLMVAHAPSFGVDPLDAHLAGLLQCAGWSAVLRALEVHGELPHLHAGALAADGMGEALFGRRDRMLAQLLRTWQVSPTLTAMAPALEWPAEEPPPLLRALWCADDRVIGGRLALLEAGGEGARPREALTA